jgi:hypothetical protein
MTAIVTKFSDLELSDESRELLETAMLELQADEERNVKKVIKDRLLEIKRLEIMLEKAKADLASLLEHDQAEILMLAGE